MNATRLNERETLKQAVIDAIVPEMSELSPVDAFAVAIEVLLEFGDYSESFIKEAFSEGLKIALVKSNLYNQLHALGVSSLTPETLDNLLDALRNDALLRQEFCAGVS